MENVIYFNLYGILNVCTFLNLVLLYVAYYLSIVEKRLEKFAFIAKVENRDLLFFFFFFEVLQRQEYNTYIQFYI